MSELGPYDAGPTAFYACQADPRCSYCLYVPAAYAPGTRMPTVVAVHGSDRPVESWRNAFAAFAERHGCLVVAPLFPCGLTEPWEGDSYKLIQPEQLRSDLILLAMLDEIAGRWAVEPAPLLLAGFSGGGQFAQRFWLLHPGRLHAVSIGAPGIVTLIDPDRGWWVGTGDLAARLGSELDVAALRATHVQLIVGDEDVDEAEVTVLEEEAAMWQPGANDAGRNRIERLRTVERNLAAHGIGSRFDLVPGVAHDERPLFGHIQAFLAGALRTESAREGGPVRMRDDGRQVFTQP